MTRGQTGQLLDQKGFSRYLAILHASRIRIQLHY